MIVRVVSGKTLRTYELEDVSQVVIMTSEGDPVALAHETPAGAIVTSHAAERDFTKTLSNLGLNAKPVEVL